MTQIVEYQGNKYKYEVVTNMERGVDGGVANETGLRAELRPASGSGDWIYIPALAFDPAKDLTELVFAVEFAGINLNMSKP